MNTPNAANTTAHAANTANGEHPNATPNTPATNTTRTHRVSVRRTANIPQRRTTTPKANANRSHGERLRLIPPFAALGTSFVLQVTVVTDTLGRSLANSQPQVFGGHWIWYLFAAALGIAVASCAEGGAAYLMDLYDKHLLARDSTWVLKVGMVLYVAGSAAVIHWWTQERGLPSVLTWLLAGMSASALFLWSRGARWKNREAMREAGQIDSALPRLPMTAKLLHPVRWAITLWLISWEPVSTTAEARTRYEQWRSAPHWWTRTANKANANTDANAGPNKAPIKANIVRLDTNTPANANTAANAIGANTRPALPGPRTDGEHLTTPPAENTPANAPANTSPTPAPTADTANAVRVNTSTPPAEANNAQTANTSTTNVRPITAARSANPSEHEANTLAAIERAFPGWRTEMPSARTLTAFLGKSSPSTGDRWIKKLRSKLESERPADATADYDRELVHASV